MKLEEQAIAVHQAFENFGKHIGNEINALKSRIEKPIAHLAFTAAGTIHDFIQNNVTPLQHNFAQQRQFALAVRKRV